MPEEIPPSILRRFAREQRARAVGAQTLIWRAARNRRCGGAKFQRQVVLGNYIVDFVCFERRLVVEIDGPSHASPTAVESDRARDVWLSAQDFHVLRLTNELVIGSAELAIEEIRHALAR